MIQERNKLAGKLLNAARQAIRRVEGSHLVEQELVGASQPFYVAGAGKAVGAMALGAQRALGKQCRWGVLIGKYDGPAELSCKICLAGHPLPDERGAAATHELLAWLSTLSPTDEVVFLLSGGASALLGAPVAQISLPALQKATMDLLAGGAPIGAINTVRRHLGLALGGKLALATRARIKVLALSDVVGNDPAAIGSGPAAADPTTFADALAIARRYGLEQTITTFLASAAQGAVEETPKPGDLRLDRASWRILACPTDLRRAAREELAQAGLTPMEHEALIEGEVGDLSLLYKQQLSNLSKESVWLAVGEPTVKLAQNAGRGGRAQQLALHMARRIEGSKAVFLALGSDGSDGPTDAAGAIVDGSTWREAIAAGLDPVTNLARCDAYPLLDELGALIRTGPTGTNLLDLHIMAR